MNRPLSALLYSALAAVFLCVACDGSGGDSSSTPATETEPTVTETEPTVTQKSSDYDIVVTPGAAVTTNGWADRANNGAGMKYPDTTNIIYIDDTTYPTTSAKLIAFANAIAFGSATEGISTLPANPESSGKNDNTLKSPNDTAAIIVLSGTVDLSNGKVSDTDHSYYDAFESGGARTHGDIVYRIGGNKTIIGVNNAKVAFGGLEINAKDNVIIRNITFWDAHGSTEVKTAVNSSSKASIDGLVLEGTPNNIWIDHCSFTDGKCSDLERNYNHDGLLDIKGGKNVTISYCEFTNHDKVTLIAPNDDYTTTTDRQITFHHNYYHDTVQRTPRSRGCQLHIYNCYYNSIGVSGNGGFMLGPGIASQYVVENNYFGTMNKSGATIVKYFDKSTESVDTFSRFYQKGNNITLSASNCSFDNVEAVKDFSKHLSATKPWTPEYDYTPVAASALPTLIPAAAGVDRGTKVEVNGTVYSN